MQSHCNFKVENIYEWGRTPTPTTFKVFKTNFKVCRQKNLRNRLGGIAGTVRISECACELPYGCFYQFYSWLRQSGCHFQPNLWLALRSCSFFFLSFFLSFFFFFLKCFTCNAYIYPFRLLLSTKLLTTKQLSRATTTSNK